MSLFDDRSFILKPATWPRRPILPLKRRAKDAFYRQDGFGIIHAAERPIYKVWLMNICSVRPGLNWHRQTQGVKHIEYPNLEELLKEWMVD